MRLIDADELKKKFNERSYWTYTHEYGDAIPIGWIMSGIDNAPTVNPLTDGILKAYSKIMDCEFEHSDGFWITTPKGKKIYFEKKRPHGSWLDGGDCKICSVCGDKSPLWLTHYCGNCGAKMLDIM